MKESIDIKVNEEINGNTIEEAKVKSPVLQKISDIFFGIFVTFLFTLPVWCILMIVVYFMNRI